MASPHRPDPAEIAKFGALLASKGLTPDEAAALVRDHALPALDEAARLIELGVDVDDIRFEIRPT